MTPPNTPLSVTVLSSALHTPPPLPLSLTAPTRAFDKEHPELRDAPLSTDVKAFVHLTGMDPERVLHSRSLGRFGGGERIFLKNSLEQVEQRAIDFAKGVEEYQRVARAIAEVAGQEVEE